jgi:hypothetical protein
MDKHIDRILDEFIPEMARITALEESEEQKERHAKTWLQTVLKKFADDVIEEYKKQNV